MTPPVRSPAGTAAPSAGRRSGRRRRIRAPQALGTGRRGRAVRRSDSPTTWHRVAPLLVRRGFIVVFPDLRGYGRSTGPAPTANRTGYSQQAVAGDVVELMRSLGHARFALTGHDRGGGTAALRVALDRPDAVVRVALIDCLPATEHLSRITAEFAARWWHCSPRSAGYPRAGHQRRSGQLVPRRPAEHEAGELRRVARGQTEPGVRAVPEDYRAGLTIDRRHEEDGRAAGARIRCPAPVLRSLRDDLEDQYGNPLEIWRRWAPDVRGHGIDAGLHVAEEAPEALASLAGFSAGPPEQDPTGPPSATRRQTGAQDSWTAGPWARDAPVGTPLRLCAAAGSAGAKESDEQYVQ